MTCMHMHSISVSVGAVHRMEPTRGYLTGVANNPRSGWLEYFGCAPYGANLPLALPF